MKSIKTKILTSFCILAVISIAVLGGIVSWKLHASISQQSEDLVADLTARTYKTLDFPHQTFDLRLRKEIRRIIDGLRQHPNIVADFAFNDLKSLQATLRTTAEKERIDFALLFNLEGHLEASFPSELDVLGVETFFTSSEPGVRALDFLKEEETEQTRIWDTISMFDHQALNMLNLSDWDMNEKGTLGIVSASTLWDDFGDPLGICVVGKLFNEYDEILEELYQTGGYASVVYFETFPLAHAGFERQGFERSSLQIDPDVQAKVYSTDELTHLTLNLTGSSYLAACSALKSSTAENLGMFCVGLPESQVTEVQQAIFSSSRDTKKNIERWIVGVGAIALSFFAFISLGLAAMIVKPIEQLSKVAGIFATGDLEQEITINSRDEVGVLADSFRDMQKTVKNSLADAERQNWFKTGQAEFGDVMRGEQDIATLAQNTVTYLAKYLSAQVGILYLLDEELSLCLVGSYAYKARKGNRNRFKLGEGLVGQAALEKQRIVFSDVPDDYIMVSSGLGETVPRYVLVMPFMYEGNVKGVIELGAIHEFTERQQEFLEQIGENLAIAFHATQVREKMQELLEETQRQSETLQVQQEELRQTNEELEEQTQALRASEERLQVQQEELRQTNDALEKQARILEQQKQELAKNNDELEQAQQLIEDKAKDLEISSKYKSEFLANMSHELRTPLNSLLILSKLLAENKEKNLTEKQVEFAHTINASGTDLLELINEVLDLSKIEAGKMVLNIEEMKLDRLSHYIEQHFTHMAEDKGLQLTLHLDEQLPATIHTDRQRLEQILKNLLSNAMKFTSQGGITVDISRPAAQTQLGRDELDLQNVVAISVSDTGVGIPEEKQRLIFEAFQQADGTTSRKYGGTGLGLSITRELSKLLGGEIQLRSREGEGSTFTLYLPYVLTEAPDVQQETVAAPIPEEGKPSPEMRSSAHAKPGGVEAIRDDRHSDVSSRDRFLLIIEDDPKFAKILFDLAREKGFKGLIAGDGAAGLQLAYQYTPSAIILDISLPGMDGWGVMEKLKRNPDTRHIPVHFISVYEQPLEAMKMGAIGYLTKPVSLEKLNDVFAAIEETISRTVKRLLIVEDDERTGLSMQELLHGNDVEITMAQTGEEAYRLLKATSFDCMVLDLGLTDISGFELLKKIKQETAIPPLPIIVYTGQDLTKEEEAQLNQHAESIIIKGVKSPERLLDEVTLFLHQMTADLPESQQRQLGLLHNKDQVLSGKTILMVDDDMRNLFALSSVLEEKEIIVQIADNGKDAIVQLEQDANIDLVLMDIMMPEMDGYETIERIRQREQFRNLPIVALTAKAMKGDRQKCLEAGANDYLSKPVDLDKLLSLLRVWLY